MKNYQQCRQYLETLKLAGINEYLDTNVDEAENKKISYLSFLNSLLESEIKYRTEKKLARNLTAAHFPKHKKIEDFDFSSSKGITKSEIA